MIALNCQRAKRRIISLKRQSRNSHNFRSIRLTANQSVSHHPFLFVGRHFHKSAVALYICHISSFSSFFPFLIYKQVISFNIISSLLFSFLFSSTTLPLSLP